MWPSGSKRLAKARVTGGHSVPIGKISQPLLRPTKAPPPLSFCKEGEVLSGNSKASDIHQTSCDFAGRDRVWLSLKKGWEVAGNTRIVTKENRTRQTPRMGYLLGKASEGTWGLPFPLEPLAASQAKGDELQTSAGFSMGAIFFVFSFNISSQSL